MACFRRGGAASTWMAPHLLMHRSLREHVCALACPRSVCTCACVDRRSTRFTLHSFALGFGCEVQGLDCEDDQQFYIIFVYTLMRFSFNKNLQVCEIIVQSIVGEIDLCGTAGARKYGVQMACRHTQTTLIITQYKCR